MDNYALPIIGCNASIIYVNNNIQLPFYPRIEANNEMRAWIVGGARLQVLNIQFFGSACQGKMSGGRRCFKGGGVLKEECGCYITKRKAEVGIALRLNIIERGGVEYIIDEFVDHWTEYTYFFKTPIDSISAGTITALPDLQDQIEQGILAIVNYINNHGAWDIVLWKKQGMVMASEDQGADRYQQQQAERIENSKTNYHIVRMTPANPDAIDLNHFKNNLMMDVPTMYINQATGNAP